MDDRAITAIWMLAIGSIVGALLGVLCKRSLLAGLFWGLIFSVIGWAIVLLDDDVAKSCQESEKRKKWIKIARIIVGSVLTVISLSGLVGVLTSPFPVWATERYIISSFIALVAMTILGIVVLWKGIRKGKNSKKEEKTSKEGESEHE